MSVAPVEMTTAAALVALKKELDEGGVDEDTTSKILVGAAHALISDDARLVVRDA